VLEDLAVVLTLGEHSAEHHGEGVARDADPIGPGAVFGGLVDDWSFAVRRRLRRWSGRSDRLGGVWSGLR
jgi:hypothetical protein